MTDKERLQRIKDRYFAYKESPEDGFVTHLMMCDIYQAKEEYGHSPCTCGLLYDLNRLSSVGDLAEKVYPKADEDWKKSYLTWEQEQADNKIPQEEKDRVNRECEKLFIEQFDGSPPEPDLDEEARIDEEEWKLIEEVFGEDFTENRQEEMWEKMPPLQPPWEKI